MSSIQLRYGHSFLPFDFDENRFQVLGFEPVNEHALSDAEIGAKLDAPIDSPRLEEIIDPGETVLIVVPDATREAAAGQIVNLLVRRLIANGTAAYDIRIIFATGIHRPVTEQEKSDILTPFIVQRLKILDHNARDLSQIIRIGETQRGIPIELNRALLEHDHIILVGGVSFHYFAGFGGGRKMICPGLCSTRTVGETHKLAFDFDRKTRSEGVGLAKLAGNAVHEEFMEIVERVNPAFAINSIVNDQREATEIFAGNWRTAHEKACAAYLEKHTVKITEKRDLVIVSCGGEPFDLNMIQAHKALEMASHACTDGGTIIFLAECADGLGRSDFLNWFEAESAAQLGEILCSKYQVNGQTAWSLLKKAEKFNVQIITGLAKEATDLMRLRKVPDLQAALVDISPESKGYILPYGGKFLIKAGN